METCDILSRLGIDASIPSHLRPEGVLTWLQGQGVLTDSPAAAWERAHLNMVRRGRRYGLVHGRLPEGSYRGNLFESVRLGWNDAALGHPLTGDVRRYTTKTPTPRGYLPASELAKALEARPHECRAIRLGTGSILYDDRIPWPDRDDWSLPTLWADGWLDQMSQGWEATARLWSDAGVPFSRIDTDIEHQKYWHHDRLRGAGCNGLWLARQMDDDRWDDLAAEFFPDFTASDWASWESWRGDDWRIKRWRYMAWVRTHRYFRPLYDIFADAFPGLVMSDANSQYSVPWQFPPARQMPFGLGELTGNIGAAKLYQAGEIHELRSHVRASTVPVVCWTQDNLLNTWAFSPEGQAYLRHAILLAGELPMVVSVDDGLPSTPVGKDRPIDILSRLLNEVDEATDGTLGKPLPPEPPQGERYLVTKIDCGNRLVAYVSWPAGGPLPTDLLPGWSMVRVKTDTSRGVWMERRT